MPHNNASDNWHPERPYNDLPLLPPPLEQIETRAVLKACIAARAALGELKQAAELIPNQAMLINTLPMLEARAMRRRRDRYLQRRTYLMDELIKAGLMPAIESDRKALEKSDPYGLRSKGLDHALTLHEFGRALFHLNQRRGFQSNRIADASKDDWTDGMFCNSAMSIRDQSGSPRLKLSKNALSWSVSVTFIASFRRVRVATPFSAQQANDHTQLDFRRQPFVVEQMMNVEQVARVLAIQGRDKLAAVKFSMRDNRHFNEGFKLGLHQFSAGHEVRRKHMAAQRRVDLNFDVGALKLAVKFRVVAFLLRNGCHLDPCLEPLDFTLQPK